MILRLVIKGDAIQIGESEFYCPCKTKDIEVANDFIDVEHEHIIGVEINPVIEKEIKESFNTKYPTWIIAFCPDTDSFFATDGRHFFWEYKEEFESEDAAIHYFKQHAKYFIKIEKEIMSNMMLRDKSKDIDKVWLENTQEWYA